jgi:hypothetical protein
MIEYKIHFAYPFFVLDVVNRLVDKFFSEFEGYAVNLQEGIWEFVREPSQCITIVAFESQLPAIQEATARLLESLGEDTALVTGSKLDTYVAVHRNGDVFTAFDEPEQTNWEKAYRRPTAVEYKPVHGGYPDPSRVTVSNDKFQVTGLVACEPGCDGTHAWSAVCNPESGSETEAHNNSLKGGKQ